MQHDARLDGCSKQTMLEGVDGRYLDGRGGKKRKLCLLVFRTVMEKERRTRRGSRGG